MNSFIGRLGIIIILLAACVLPVAGQFVEKGGAFLDAMKGKIKDPGKMTVKLKRKKPPQVYLMAETINVRVTPPGNVYAPQIESMLESALLGNYRRMRSAARNPEISVTCQITRVDSVNRRDSRTTQETERVNQRQVWNPEKKKYETQYETKKVPVTSYVRIVGASINVSFRVQDRKRNQILDADNIFTSFTKDYPEGQGVIPSAADVEQALVRQIVEQITARIAPTFEEVEVMLPVGDWKNTSRLGQAGLWGQMNTTLEELEDPKRKPKDDAYRLFGIGLANEALAYEAEDLQGTLQLLDIADSNYRKAIKLNVEEKYFLIPQKRVSEAVLQYQKLLNQQAAYAKAKGLPLPARVPSASGTKTIAPPPAPDGAKNTQALTNQNILDFAKQGADEATLIAAIRSAAAVQFDFSAPAISELIAQKVTGRVIDTMREKQTLTRRPAAPARKKTKP